MFPFNIMRISENENIEHEHVESEAETEVEYDENSSNFSDYPLNLICRRGGRNLEKVRALIDAGADVNSIDLYGETPIYAALGNSSTEVVKLLIQAGANVNIVVEKKPISNIWK